MFSWFDFFAHLFLFIFPDWGKERFERALLRFQTRADFETLSKPEGTKKPSIISAEPGGNVIYKASSWCDLLLIVVVLFCCFVAPPPLRFFFLSAAAAAAAAVAVAAAAAVQAAARCCVQAGVLVVE